MSGHATHTIKYVILCSKACGVFLQECLRVMRIQDYVERARIYFSQTRLHII